MFKKSLIYIYRKSFDIPDMADEIFWTAIITRENRWSQIVSFFLIIPFRIVLSLIGMALRLFSLIASGGHVSEWNMRDIENEIKDISQAVVKLYDDEKTYNL